MKKFLYYCIETGRLYTARQIENIRQNETDDANKHETLQAYINACMAYNNGSLYRVDNVTKNNLIKMYRAFYKALPFWDRDDETDRFMMWKSLRSLTRAELYTELYYNAPEMFNRLTY